MPATVRCSAPSSSAGMKQRLALTARRTGRPRVKAVPHRLTVVDRQTQVETIVIQVVMVLSLRWLSSCPCCFWLSSVSHSCGTKHTKQPMTMPHTKTRHTPHGKSQLLPPATPYYPFARGKIHTRGNTRSFTVGCHECCDPAGGVRALCNSPCSSTNSRTAPFTCLYYL